MSGLIGAAVTLPDGRRGTVASYWGEAPNPRLHVKVGDELVFAELACCRLAGARERLPSRRPARTITFEHGDGPGAPRAYTVQAGFYPGGERVGEVFIQTADGRSSELDRLLGDAAILASFLFQAGGDLPSLVAALTRRNGQAGSPIAAALLALHRDLTDGDKP